MQFKYEVSALGSGIIIISRALGTFQDDQKKLYISLTKGFNTLYMRIRDKSLSKLLAIPPKESRDDVIKHFSWPPPFHYLIPFPEKVK